MSTPPATISGGTTAGDISSSSSSGGGNSSSTAATTASKRQGANASTHQQNEHLAMQRKRDELLALRYQYQRRCIQPFSILYRFFGAPFTHTFLPSYLRSSVSPALINAFGVMFEVVAAILSSLDSDALLHPATRESGMCVWGCLAASMVCFLVAPSYCKLHRLYTSLDPFFDVCSRVPHQLAMGVLVGSMLDSCFTWRLFGFHVSSMRIVLVWLLLLKELHACLYQWSLRLDASSITTSIPPPSITCLNLQEKLESGAVLEAEARRLALTYPFRSPLNASWLTQWCFEYLEWKELCAVFFCVGVVQRLNTSSPPSTAAAGGRETQGGDVVELMGTVLPPFAWAMILSLLLRAAVFVRLHTAEVNKQPTATEPNSPTKKSASIRSGDGRGGPLAWVLGLTLLTIVAALQSTVFTESSLPIPLRYMRSSSSSSRGMIPEAGLTGACLVIILDVLWRSFGSPAGIAEAAAAAKLLQLAASTGSTEPSLRAPLAADAVREELLASLSSQLMSLRGLIDEVVVVGASSASSATSTPGASSAPDRLALGRVSVVLREVEREMLPQLTRQQLVQFKESTEGPRRRLTLALSSLRVGVLPEAVSVVTEGGVEYPVYELPPPIPHTDTRRVTSPTHLSMAIAFLAPLSVLLSLPPQLLGTLTTTSDAAYYRSCALAVPWLYAVYLLLQLSAAHHDVPLLHPVQNLLIDGVFDLCHVGHKKHMKAALDYGRSGGQRGGGQQLYVGVCGDETCVGYKRLPIMNTAERVREVRWCGFAVDVIPNYPVDGTLSEILAYYPIHRMLCGEEYQKAGDHYYAVPRLLGMLDTTPRTKGISSSDIVSRMERRQAAAKKKQS